ncbi:MBL fold metallo-hydrolase [Bordetella genomosp. 4]|nr:MBL fold metallo-hydrolase [Bordetella genomosp. 4]
MQLFRRWMNGNNDSQEVSPSRRYFLAAGCVCCAAYALKITPAQAESAEVQRHLAAARAAAGDDLKQYLRLAEVAQPIPGKKSPSIEELMALPAPPPGKAFDNLYFVGGKWVSAWAIPTSEGIILIDAMNNADDAEHVIDAGMRKLGLDPAQIKMVVITHGHGDHYGGADYFAQKYQSKIVASKADWDMMETKLEFDISSWGKPPKRDVAVDDGAKLTLGDTTVDVVLTPGHTMGTISLAFDVKDKGQTHRALLWGGTSFNFGKQPNRMERLQAYLDATARVHELAGKQNIDVFISNHAGFDLADVKLAQMKTDGPNPFVMGVNTTQRALTVMRECALATQVVWAA